MKTLQTYLQENFKISRNTKNYKPSRLLNMLGYYDEHEPDKCIGEAKIISQWVKENNVDDFEIYTNKKSFDTLYNEVNDLFGIVKSNYSILRNKQYNEMMDKNIYACNCDCDGQVKVYTNQSTLILINDDYNMGFIIKAK